MPLLEKFLQRFLVNKAPEDVKPEPSLNLDKGNFLYNGEFLIKETEFGWMCFPKNQLNHALSYQSESFDIGMRRWIANNCNEDTTYIDIGSNAGTFCGIASRRISSGQVIAIEPIPEMEKSIRMNVQLNNPMIKFYHHACALGEQDADGTEFEVFEFDNRVSTLFGYNNDCTADRTTKISVAMKSFASLKIEPTKNVIIKIDAEGAEIPILKEIFDYFKSFPKLQITVCFEYAMSHIERSGYSYSDLMILLEDTFGSNAHFVHPISAAEHPPLNEETKNISGNLVFRYFTSPKN
jgi:FkbM family methyltransferase